MSKRLDGKVAFVTGAGGGIGEATAKLFVEEGAQVAMADVNPSDLEEAARGIDPTGEHVLTITADLSQEPEAERAIRATVERFSRLDVLANVAGVRVYGPITAATQESWDFILRVNLLAVAYCSKFAIPEMARGGGGSIVNVSSANAEQGRPGMAQYDASKAALLALTRSMAADHAEQKIRVNAVLPGITLTKFHLRNRARQHGISLEQAEAEMHASAREHPHNVMKRWGLPREIAQAILFLASDEASFVTASSLLVDGGLGR